ncbi:YbaY family lipoprotein [Rahnella ecdela]|uniref:YbaY family lipoprotein n=1 Tax=Rahnella ecdela TaxID=2816250 RepID=A0ABS6LMF0_9GAMM|nr:YbaY family lipoprotein [Rahnella ecdela]MBU9848110.1 YbaY family lipoprotein [Rahnella ecdela]
MKLWQIVGGTALSLTLAGCAQHHEAPAQQPPVNTAASPVTEPAITGPNVSGSVFINQRVALPPDAVLTVTLSDASVADAPSRVISQKVARTQGKQAPFTFILPYNPQEIAPNARVLLSAAVTINGQVTFVTDSIKEVINNGQGTRADLQLVPVVAVPVATKPNALGPMTNPSNPGLGTAPAPVSAVPTQSSTY